MTTFDERETAFENKYAHDEQLQFKVEARRNKLLGLWAAGLMGKSGDEAAAYAAEVIKSDFEEAGHEDVVRKVLETSAISPTTRRCARSWTSALAEAKAQVMSEA